MKSLSFHMLAATSYVLHNGVKSKKMVIEIPYELVSHTRKICRLYKKWLRNLNAWHPERPDYRYHAVLARCDFEKLLCEKDMIKAKCMIAEKEEELLKNAHPCPLIFTTSPEGVCFERYTPTCDGALDYWHPLEKSLCPKFFEKREIRKQQYIEMWERQYGACKSKTQ